MTIQEYAKKNGFAEAIKSAEGDGFEIYYLRSLVEGIVGVLQFAVVDNGLVEIYPIGHNELCRYLDKATKTYDW